MGSPFVFFSSMLHKRARALLGDGQLGGGGDQFSGEGERKVARLFEADAALAAVEAECFQLGAVRIHGFRVNEKSEIISLFVEGGGVHFADALRRHPMPIDSAPGAVASRLARIFSNTARSSADTVARNASTVGLGNQERSGSPRSRERQRDTGKNLIRPR